MKINSIKNYNSSFKGLWGTETGKSIVGTVELFRINRFYPFADDKESDIKRELIEGLSNGVKNKRGETFPFSKQILVEEKLPFTREEYEAYKLKRHSKLTQKEKHVIEPFLNLFSGHGLAMYKNSK